MKKRQSVMRNLICTGAAVAAALVVMMLPGVTMVAHAAGEGTSAESPILIGPATGVLVESGTLAVAEKNGKKYITMRKGMNGSVETVLSPEFSTDRGKVKYSASGGITVKSGVITAKKVTKKKKPAKFTVSCGKKKAVVYVNVEK